MKPFDFKSGEAAERQTVVLLHSSASSSRQWNALVELLGARFDVRTVDFHGHGTQPAWSGAQPLTLAGDAALVEPILREKGSVHLVGHSYGGAVALKVAEMHPQSVRSLIVYEPVLFGWLFKDDQHAIAAREVLAMSVAMGRYVQLGDDHAAAAVFVNYWSGAGAWEQLHPSRQNAIAARMRAVHPHFGALYREELARTPGGRIDMPLLHLTGKATAASTRRIGALAREAMPYATHGLIADAGHMGPITHPSEVNSRIEQFLVALATPDVAALRKAAWARWSRSGGATRDRSLDQLAVESS
jgi:pimeloyl-ACP methyl ester carboxylesterase